jgi:hypothetical protein
MGNPAQAILKIGTIPAVVPGPPYGYLTLDWSKDPGDGSPYGMMGRLLLRNRGSKSVWFAFDVDGDTITADNTSNPKDTDMNPTQRFELLPNESINIDSTSFYKVGLACASGEGTVVHASAFQSSGGTGGVV